MIGPRPPFRAAGLRGIALSAALAAALVGGCGPAEPSSTPALVPPDAASPRRSATTPGLGDPLADFEGRLRDATGREGALVRAVAAASIGDAGAMRAAVAQMRTWVVGERAWRSAHAALECFAAADARFGDAVAAMTAAADGFAAGSAGSAAPADDPAGAAAAAALQDAGRALADAAALAKTARTNCR